jgi:hypothetical protein
MKWLAKTETVNLKLLVPSGLTVAAGVGAAVGYVVASKILEKKYRELADKEIAEARVLYQRMYSRSPLVLQPESEVEEDPEEGDEEAPAGTWDELEEVVQDRLMTNAMKAMGTYVPPAEDHEGVEKREPTTRNTFADYQAPGDEVMDALMADRDPSEPYIITKSEYYENEPDHEQKRFTYYDGDQVLVDDQDEYNPIMDTERVVGDDNLLRFGYGSGDEHSLFVRNETLDPPLDLYITRSTGRYTDEVMGLDEDQPHLKHSQSRKFRLHDE